MHNKLSDSQKKIVDCGEKRIIVKACPGSGKTFSVIARLAKSLESNTLKKHQGIATLSFTNVACDEIKDGLKKRLSMPEIPYPHHIGTIDSFINNFIFLPYGHLLMKCQQRSEIVDTEYNKWFDYDPTKRTFEGKIIDPDYFFNKVSFDIDYNPIALCNPQAFNFSWLKKTRKKDGTFIKKITDIIDRKEYHFSNGKAIQSDANYFAYKILTEYPLIAQNIINRFPILIVDEAQDTTAIQMAIVDIFDKCGMQSIMLVGDPDQAIFEWNNADVSLFMEKYKSPNWHKLDLQENRRSSTNICTLLNNFFKGNMQAESTHKDYPEFPAIKSHQGDKISINYIVEEFKIKCTELSIKEESYAIVFRAHSFGEDFFDLINENKAQNNSIWKNDNFYVRDIVQGKFLIDNGLYKKGIKSLEKGFLKQCHNMNYISTKFIKEKISEQGYRAYQKDLHDFVDKLPITDNKTLNDWILESEKVGFTFLVNKAKANVEISNIFHENKINSKQQSCGKTIHSVKGMSLDAILVFITKNSASKDYKTILSENYKEADEKKEKKDSEEIRIIYVACSRPRKLLWVAVPEHDLKCWENKLQPISLKCGENKLKTRSRSEQLSLL